MGQIAGLVLATFVLAACAGSGDGESAEPATSPLEDTLQIASDPGRRQYQLLTEQRSADAQMVQCMQDAGFFYAVETVDESLRPGAYVGDGTREWTSVHGLGITSSFLDLFASDTGSSDTASAGDAIAENLSYVNSLTPEETAAYDAALIGAATPGATAEAYAPAGCWGEAFNDIVEQITYISAFGDQLDSLNSRLRSDPRVLTLEMMWSECMDAMGYRYANQQALVDDVYARLLKVEIDSNRRPTPSSQQLLDELLVYEQAAALASLDCRSDFQDEINQLRYDYEQEFLDDNRFKIGEIQNDTP